MSLQSNQTNHRVRSKWIQMPNGTRVLRKKYQPAPSDSAKGLSVAKAQERLQKYGPKKLASKKSVK